MVISIAPKRVAGYNRVSTDRQAEEGRSSLETQEARIRARVAGEDWILVGMYMDVESGRRDGRHRYQQMLEAVRAGKIDVVVVQYLDRFGRKPQEILSRIWELRDLNVSVVATDEDIEDELMLLVKAGVAGQDSKRNSERVKATMENSAKKGVHVGKAPYGLNPVRVVKDGKAIVDHWEIDEAEAEVVREMVRLSTEDNLGFKGIADSLNGRGMMRGGSPWRPGSVQMILRNPALKGLMVYGKSRQRNDPSAELIEVPGVYPAILSDDEWNALQQRLDIRRRSPRGSTHRSVYLLSGIAKCGYCGGPMTGKAGASYKGKRYRSYQCVNAKKARALCAFHNSHGLEKLEAAVLEYLSQFSDPKRVKGLLDQSSAKELKRKQAELTRIEKKLTELDRDFHRNLDLHKKGILNEDEFAEANRARRDERAATEIRLAELREQFAMSESARQTAQEVPTRIKSFTESFRDLDVPRAKALLQTILRAVYVWNDNRIELEFRNS